MKNPNSLSLSPTFSLYIGSRYQWARTRLGADFSLSLNLDCVIIRRQRWDLSLKHCIASIQLFPLLLFHFQLHLPHHVLCHFCRLFALSTERANCAEPISLICYHFHATPWLLCVLFFCLFFPFPSMALTPALWQLVDFLYRGLEAFRDLSFPLSVLLKTSPFLYDDSKSMHMKGSWFIRLF